MTRKAVVFSHTHWDREWYRSFEGFRYRLVEVVDAVLDLLESGRYPYFLLDGQTIVLDDYLEIRPEASERLRTLIRSGRLQVGPWYVLPDEALVSGESLVRNLLIGQRMAASFGKAGTVGYLPDMFGHVPMMPAILHGFGLERAVIWRGVNPERADFTWRAPDGTAVLALHLPIGYYNTSFIQQDLPALTKQIEDLARRHAGDLLIPDGGDHLAPNDNLPEFLTMVKAALPAYDWRHGTIDAMMDVLPADDPERPVITGELRHAGGAYVLPGVLSTRSYLKQANHRLELLLSHWAEPLAAWAGMLGAGYPASFLDLAWRLLLQNQPHDSICGCSIDEVHREMMPRFARAADIAETVCERALAVIGEAAAPEAGGLVVVNPLPEPFAGPVTVEMDWLEGQAPEALSLLAAGQPVPMVAGEPVATRRFVSDIRLMPDWENVTRRQVTFWAEVPACGALPLTVSGRPAPAVPPVVQTGESWIATATVRLEAGERGLSLTDLTTGHVWQDCLAFVDEGDAGDTYTYSPPRQDERIEAQLLGTSVQRLSPWQATLTLRYGWSLPDGLTADRNGRQAARTAMPFEVRLTVTAGSAGVKLEVIGDNRVDDHRWRLLWRAPGAEAAWSDTPFGVVRRPIPESLPDYDVAKGQERAEPTFPIRHWASVERQGQGLALVTGGLAEGEIEPGAHGPALAVTLVRGVGWLSRDDLRTRGGGAGPAFPTPEAQCRGPFKAEMWLVPYSGTWQSARLPWQALALQVGVRTWQGQGRGRNVDWPLNWPADMVLSAAKMGQEGDLVLRGYAPDGQADVPAIRWQDRTGRALGLDERPLAGPAAGAIRTVAFDAATLDG